ncbi:MAG: hypothetical protein IKG76_04230, partial [Firmicutes bacterium]|nr:hypothetical protein [Bacillota bacterium]
PVDMWSVSIQNSPMLSGCYPCSSRYLSTVRSAILLPVSTNPVPFIYCDYTGEPPRELAEGALCDIAPTMLDAAGIPQPADMTGKSLLR